MSDSANKQVLECQDCGCQLPSIAAMSTPIRLPTSFGQVCFSRASSGVTMPV